MQPGKFCSLTCYWKAKIGEKHSWGHKISESLKGKPKSATHIENARNASIGVRHPKMQGQNHPFWKADAVGYDALHDWVRRYRGIPKLCEECGQNEKGKAYHWANISGKYLRDLGDWKRLCVPCHSKMDKYRHSMKSIWTKDKKKANNSE